MIRSLLFVPADSERKLQKSLSSEADALIFDLEDSVAPANKENGRACLATFLKGLPKESAAKTLFVRVNALDSDHTLRDLAAVMPHAPFGVLLPKCRHGADVQTLANYLSAFEAAQSPALPHESTKILAIATESAEAIFGLGEYGSSPANPRLWGLMWGGEDLMADLGALAHHDDDKRWTAPFVHARTMCLLAAARAGVMAIDTVMPAIDDAVALEAECKDAKRDGFGAKAAIHPNQVEVINRAFSPSEKAMAWARRVLEAVANAGGGVAKLDGQMIDAPHVRTARRILGV